MAEGIPKAITSALNQLAHMRGQLHATQACLRMRREIKAMLDSGMTPEQALQELQDNPPVVDPEY